MQEDKNQYQGAEVVVDNSSTTVDNTLAEQEYYYEDGCIYIAGKNGYSVLNVQALYPKLMNMPTDSFQEKTECSAFLLPLDTPSENKQEE
ncbi:Hypothetical protein ZAZAV_68 [Cedratvirus Zaza IHUMI]|uniref:Uncharacterized protein n=1 Tax=Cedratvirus Zaza IHUMI TaxID=2126979 RepID=A0A2R8FD17_9VIRU|nr:Hypothetical protein ZAZAV_68 [Cedratvirus Zaza IHUMI]